MLEVLNWINSQVTEDRKLHDLELSVREDSISLGEYPGSFNVNRKL